MKIIVKSSRFNPSKAKVDIICSMKEIRKFGEDTLKKLNDKLEKFLNSPELLERSLDYFLYGYWKDDNEKRKAIVDSLDITHEDDDEIETDINYEVVNDEE